MLRICFCPSDINRLKNVLIDVKQLSENYMVEMIKNCLHVHTKLQINSLIPYIKVTESLSDCKDLANR